MPTPIAAGDLLYLVSNQGVVTAYQTATGERVYQQRLSPNQGTSLSGSPVYADGKLYFPSEDGDVFVVKAGEKFELLSTNPVGGSSDGDTGDLRWHDLHSRRAQRICD